MNTINDILKYKDTVEVIAKHDKNTWVRVMVFASTFNNMSAISWWSVVLVEETGIPGENHLSAASHCHT